MYKTLFWKLLFPSFFALSAVLPAVATEAVPRGLMTDLIEHTDRVWINGYPTNLSLRDAVDAIEPVQCVKIVSRYPTLSWIVPDAGDGMQSAYRVILADNPDDALAGRGNVWDSGVRQSALSVAVPYCGPALGPDRIYYWRVRTRNGKGMESPWSAVKSFRTAASLSDHGVSGYPLVRTQEYPAGVVRRDDGSYYADFGRAAFAQPALTLFSASGEDTVCVHLGERLRAGRIQRDAEGTSIRYQRYELPLLRGRRTYRIKIRRDERNTGSDAVLMPAWIGEVLPFRYCEIEGCRADSVEPRLFREAVHYPFDETAASFRSSNDTLNRIWELCKYSIRATSFAGLYVDGDRERIPYEADALINQLCHYCVDREYSLARRTFEYLVQHPTWPTEWILQAVLIGWNDYLYTGDTGSLQRNYEVLKARVLMQLREKNGLISTTTGLQTPEFLASIRMTRPISDIVDWPRKNATPESDVTKGESDGFVFTDYNVVTNAFHYQTLKLMEKIAGALGHRGDEAFYAREKAAFGALFVRSFFDFGRGCFTDGLRGVTDHCSLHGNMFALAFGLVPDGRRDDVVRFIESRGMACSVYGAQFLMEALYRAEKGGYALQLLTDDGPRSWYNMLRAGATVTLEAWDNIYKPNQDWNHAWGAVPANIIPRCLMGVEPLTPGFGRVRIKPQTGSLAWAEAEVPTIRGTIRVGVSNDGRVYRLRAVVPPNMRAEVYLPCSGKKQVFCNGTKSGWVRMKNSGYVYAGTFDAGTYEFRVE